MKKSLSIMMALIIAQLFAGCAEKTLPSKDTEETEQYMNSEAQEEVAEEYCTEESDEEKYNESKPQEPAEDKEAVMIILSEEEMAHIRSVAEEYYTAINRKMLDFTLADPESSFIRDYEGYKPDEVVLFEVSVENSENKRYITIGSNDDWNNCSVLNEGY